jgi:16S rRNA (guanine527-N7)-methyltransferase
MHDGATPAMQTPEMRRRPKTFHVKQSRSTAIYQGSKPERSLEALGSIRGKLEAYVSLLDKWRPITNLISAASFEQVWQRHVLDCLQILSHVPAARRWLDIGSGAGFPGLILAIQLADSVGAQVHCVESDGRKCAFLREVVRQLQLPVVVHNRRIETLDPQTIAPIEAVTARAVASTAEILTLSREFLERGATLILPRGQTAEHELEALDLSHYTVQCAANTIDQTGVVLIIRKRAEGLDGAGHQSQA